MNVIHGRAPVAPEGTSAVGRRLLRRRQLPSGWPLTALLVFFPLWWALGLGAVIFPVVAVPMGMELLRRRSLKFPPGFAIWVLFLLWVVAGVLVLGRTAPGTIPEPASSHLFGFTFRLVNYLAVTVILLYVGNLTEQEMPRVRLGRMLGLFGLMVIAGGVLGVVWPTFSFTSPFEMVLPGSLAGNSYVQALVHPSSAQVMDVLGGTGRPKAPFPYTNTWGNSLSVLLIWLVVGWWAHGSRRQKWAAIVALCVASVPIVYSLNRGLWVALGVFVLYVAVRLAARGRLFALGGIGAAVAVGGILFAVSPLQDTVAQRMANPHSDQGRIAASLAAVEATSGSPILGYGNTRTAYGSGQSIAVGPSSECSRCGITIGGNGQLWLLIISNGYVGAGLYLAFFVCAIFRYRRDVSPIGLGGVLALFLPILYAPLYAALTAPLFLYFISIGLLWRNDMYRRDADQRASPSAAPTALPRASIAGDI